MCLNFPSNTSMGTSPHKFRGPSPTVHGTAGPVDHGSVQQGKVLLEPGMALVQRFWIISRGWMRFRAGPGAMMRIKFTLGHRLRMHNVCTQQSRAPAQGKGCSLSGCAGRRQLSLCPGAAQGGNGAKAAFWHLLPGARGLNLPLMFHEI